MVLEFPSPNSLPVDLPMDPDPRLRKARNEGPKEHDALPVGRIIPGQTNSSALPLPWRLARPRPLGRSSKLASAPEPRAGSSVAGPGRSGGNDGRAALKCQLPLHHASPGVQERRRRCVSGRPVLRSRGWGSAPVAGGNDVGLNGIVDRIRRIAAGYCAFEECPGARVAAVSAGSQNDRPLQLFGAVAG